MAEISDEQLKLLLANQEKYDTLIKAMGEMSSEIKNLRENKQDGPIVLKENRDREMSIRTLNDKIVVGFHNRGTAEKPVFTYEVPDPDNKDQKVLMVDLLLLGEENPIRVQYGQFQKESGRLMGKCIKENATPFVIKQGSVRRKEIDGYNMIETDVIVPVEIRGFKKEYVLQVEGIADPITVDEMLVNI